MVVAKKRFSFKRKVIVITGGASGIGRCLALKLASVGAKIAILDIDAEQMDALKNKVEQGPTKLKCYLCDVAEEASVKRAIEKVIIDFGEIDVLVNNAGVTHKSLFSETEMAVIQTVMAVNFFGAIYATQHALPSITKKQGMVITLSSMAGLMPMLERSAYSASKHALHGFFEGLRWELKPKGVHVMLVCPGLTETDLHKNALLGNGSCGSKPPRSWLGQLSSPGAVAEAIYRGASAKKRVLILSNVGKRARWLAILMPSLFEKYFYRYMQTDELYQKKS